MVAGAAAPISAATSPAVFPPPTTATPPPPLPGVGRDPAQRPGPSRPLLRRTGRRREARIYSWSSRSFLSVDPSSPETVVINRHGNSVYGTCRLSLPVCIPSSAYFLIPYAHPGFSISRLLIFSMFLNGSSLSALVLSCR